jgi:uracil-DNA glycosylase
MWLSFSVPEWIKIPPSLRNIYKELWIKSNNWDLTNWAKEWVFLLNSILTVQSWKPASHSKIWWETFTDNVIQYISNNQENIVFLLWWAYAQSKKKFINQNKHFIIETSHPSPLSAYRWFLWSDCFNKCNEILKKNGINKVNWLK